MMPNPAGALLGWLNQLGSVVTDAVHAGADNPGRQRWFRQGIQQLLDFGLIGQAGSSHSAKRSLGMMTREQPRTWPKAPWVVVVRTVQVNNHSSGSSSVSAGSGQNSYRPAKPNSGSFVVNR